MKNAHARKRRQLKSLADQLHQLILKSEGQTTPKIRELVSKMRSLVNELRHRISTTDLRKALGAAALFFGLSFSQTAEAQNFLPPITNPYGIQTSYYLAFPATADLDNDGDMDVLIGEYYGNMQYYENTGNAQIAQFAAPVQNPFGLDSTYEYAFPEFADMDGDGDMDLLVIEYYGNFKYFRNIGTPTNPSFAPAQTNPMGLQPVYEFGQPTIADLDNDGDLDIITGEYYGTLKFYENIGGVNTPLFSAPVDNPFGLSSTYQFAFPDLGDLDNDGDFDLIVGEYYGHFTYFENTGNAANPSFAAPVQNPFGLDSAMIAIPEFVDLDGDGDLDLLVGSYYGSTLYYENGQPQAIREEQAQFDLTVYPNPTRNVLNLTADERIAGIEIVDLSGRVVTTIQNVNNTIDVSGLSKGTYMVRFTTTSGLTRVEKFQKL